MEQNIFYENGLPRESKAFKGYSVIVEITKTDNTTLNACYDSYNENWKVSRSRKSLPLNKVVSWKYLE